MLVALRCLSEPTQQSHTIAFAKSRYGQCVEARLALDVLGDQIFSMRSICLADRLFSTL
jgi:hypothetical protein